ncbi:succinylglutamate desuccinylase [Vibrio rumoiensis]|uniref:Succinylglutamate desuccinylase n=1 Tax=Vibrio rumoiensis 1S-45 TaxID=1188252 RepID=A0A1E5E049_9VIBR|nr:succinylglutamate desuccinylase [Vibrio rumoiensis]OEF23841.1 succinylglutamate desuccinylase [Vibrio rumoiensis 1S-45]
MFDFLSTTLSRRQPEQQSGETNQLMWQWLEEGVLLLEPILLEAMHLETQSVANRDVQDQPLDSVLLSVGVHGNETAPIEILNRIVSDLMSGDLTLKVRLLVMIGNIDAMIKGERYLELDLNRLFSNQQFSGQHAKFTDCAETQRAKQLEGIVSSFFDQAENGRRFHFDMHTAIRGSHHQRFALLPYKESTTGQAQGVYSRTMFDWLGSAGIDAVVVNQAPSGTFSYFSSHYCLADSCTLELGKAKPFGENDLNQFEGINLGVRNMISQGMPLNHDESNTSCVKVYQVTQQLTKLTEDFQLNFNDEVKNFTSFQYGEVLAQDGKVTYQVEQPQEWVLFPNAKVRPGLRAGLMLVQVNKETLF